MTSTFLNEIFSDYSHDLSAFIWQILPTFANLCRNGAGHLSKKYINDIFNEEIPSFVVVAVCFQPHPVTPSHYDCRSNIGDDVGVVEASELEIPEIYNNDDKTTATAIRYTLHGWKSLYTSLITRHKKYNTRAQLLPRWPRNVAQVEWWKDGVGQFSEKN